MAASIAEFEKALISLQDGINLFKNSAPGSPEQKAFRDACIQRFEFCVELAWKTAAKLMGSSSTAANSVIREMARDGLINDPELWFSFVTARNQTSHSYDEAVAQKVFAEIIKFQPEAATLLKRLKSK